MRNNQSGSTVLSSHHILIESSFEHLDRIVEETEHFLRKIVSDEDKIYQIMLLTTEAVTNAIEHGNQLNPDKMVTVDYLQHERQIEVHVLDEGQGFTRTDVEDPLKDANLLHDGGRGIFLMEELADAVRYEKGGRKICLSFKI